MTTAEPNTRFRVWKVILPVLAVLALVLAGLQMLKSSLPTRTVTAEMQVGSKVPDFILQQFQGGKVGSADLKGKVILVNFWATWCEACMVEMPSLIKLRNSYKERGFEMVSINVDENPESVIPATLKQLGIDFPIYTDAGGKLAELFDVHAIPLTVIIDKDHKVLLIESGERDWNGSDIREQVDRWLTG